jgi:hypothetical protein
MNPISSPSRRQSHPGERVIVRPRWDRRRRFFVVCVGAWTVLVFMFDGGVKRNGFISSLITGGLLTVASWAMTKLGWNDSGPRLDLSDGALIDPAPTAQTGE